MCCYIRKQHLKWLPLSKKRFSDWLGIGFINEKINEYLLTFLLKHIFYIYQVIVTIYKKSFVNNSKILTDSKRAGKQEDQA